MRKHIKEYGNFILENTLSLDKFRSMIEYTYLREGSVKETISKFAEEAIDNNFYSLCVPKEFVSYVRYTFEESPIKVVSVVDFPNGTAKTADKVNETIELISEGVQEINVVFDYKAFKRSASEPDEKLKKAAFDQLQNEISLVAKECHKSGVILKVIVEMGLLTLEEISIVASICGNGGADFIMTSTGTKGTLNEVSKIKELRRCLPDYVKICLSGGIRTLSQMDQFNYLVDRFAMSVIPK